MGAWGANIYEDDTALDVKDQFEELIRKGKTVEEITGQLIDQYNSAMDDIYCAPTFWFALADTQWNWGRLLPEVKEQALAWLDNGGDLAVWREENPTLAATREKAFVELRQKLNSPQPPEKKAKNSRLYRCEWKMGDVFAYQLESDLAKEKGLFGRYFLIQKVDEGTWHPGHIIPIVRVKITTDEKLPASVEEFDQLEYVQTAARQFDPFVEEFRPTEKNLTKEELFQKVEERKANLKFDEYGFLPTYRIELLTTSRIVIPKKLIFIGNFPQIASPCREFIPKNKIELSVLHWKKFNETLETELIKRYFWFNKRQAKIYQTN